MTMHSQKQFKFKYQWSWLVGVTIVTLTGWSIGLVERVRVTESVSEAVEVRTVTARKGTVEAKISGQRGILELKGQRGLASPSQGTVEKVAVKVGEQVKAGQTLILLEDPQRQTRLEEYQYKLQEKERNLQRQLLKVARTQKELTQLQAQLKLELENFQVAEARELQKKQWAIEKQELDLAESKQQIEEAKKELQDAREKLQADEQLFARGFIPEDQFQDQKKRVRRAELDLQNSRSRIRKNNISLAQLRSELQQLQQQIAAGVSQPQKQVRQAKKQVIETEGKLQQAEDEVEQARIELQKLQLERQKIREEADQNLITAPINGVILELMVEEGEIIKKGSSLLTIGDPSEEIVKFELSIIDAPKVKPNQLALVSVIGPENQVFTGQVKEVSLVAKNRTGASQNQGTVSATVKLDRPSGVIPGSLVNIDVILDRRENVVVLDSESIQESGATTFVWMMDRDNRLTQQAVTVGLEDLLNTEIISGVQPGDEVVLPPLEGKLESGDLVKLISSIP